MSGTTSDAIWGTLQSPNEADSNLESANVVDGLFAIARSITRLAKVIEGEDVAQAITDGIGEALAGDAEAAIKEGVRLALTSDYAMYPSQIIEAIGRGTEHAIGDKIDGDSITNAIADGTRDALSKAKPA